MVISSAAAATDYVALEVEFREDVHQIRVEYDGEEPTYAEFARQIANLYALPSAWAITSMSVKQPVAAAVATVPSGTPAQQQLAAQQQQQQQYYQQMQQLKAAPVSTDAELLAALALAKTKKDEGGQPLRLRLERFGIGLSDSMGAFGTAPSSGSLADRARDVRIMKAKATQGQTASYTQPIDPRFQAIVFPGNQSHLASGATLLKNMVNTAASNLNHWTALKPGTDTWVDWQQEVKDVLIGDKDVSLALGEHIKFVVPPRSPKSDSSYMLLCSAGWFYYYPFTSASGRKFAVVGRPSAMHAGNGGPGAAAGGAPELNGVMENQIPLELLTKLRQLGPDVQLPDEDPQKEMHAQKEAQLAADAALLEMSAEKSEEKLMALRQQRQAEYYEKQFRDFDQQFRRRGTHDRFFNLTRGIPTVIAHDLTLLVVDDVHCLMGSLRRIEKPTDRHEMQEKVRTILSQVLQVTTYDVAATMMLDTEQRQATERQRDLLAELEREEVTLSPNTKKKKKKERQKAAKMASMAAASSAASGADSSMGPKPTPPPTALDNMPLCARQLWEDGETDSEEEEEANRAIDATQTAAVRISIPQNEAFELDTTGGDWTEVSSLKIKQASPKSPVEKAGGKGERKGGGERKNRAKDKSKPTKAVEKQAAVSLAPGLEAIAASKQSPAAAGKKRNRKRNRKRGKAGKGDEESAGRSPDVRDDDEREDEGHEAPLVVLPSQLETDWPGLGPASSPTVLLPRQSSSLDSGPSELSEEDHSEGSGSSAAISQTTEPSEPQPGPNSEEEEVAPADEVQQLPEQKQKPNVPSFREVQERQLKGEDEDGEGGEDKDEESEEDEEDEEDEELGAIHDAEPIYFGRVGESMSPPSTAPEAGRSPPAAGTKRYAVAFTFSGSGVVHFDAQSEAEALSILDGKELAQLLQRAVKSKSAVWPGASGEKAWPQEVTVPLPGPPPADLHDATTAAAIETTGLHAEIASLKSKLAGTVTA